MKLTGGQIIIKALEHEGVPYVLGIPGHGILGFFDALRESEQQGRLKYIQVMQEQSAVHIADGYFRMTGKPLAVFTSIGPGALNTAIGLATAYVDSSAVFQVSGDTHVQMKGVGVLQEIERYQDSNFIRALEPLVKRAWRAESAGQLPRIMQRAFNQMLTGRNGPVLVSLPMNVQADAVEAKPFQSGAHRASGLPAGDPATIEQAATLMAEASRPVILVGGGVLRRGMQKTLVALAERWGAAVVTTMAGKSAFPEDHALNGFHTGSKGTPVGLQLCANADVILALGTRFADETTCSYKEGVSFSFGKTKLIHVDIDAAEIGKNYPCAVGIVGDVLQVSDQLLSALPSDDLCRPDYFAEIKDLRDKWAQTLANKRAVQHEKITISQLIGELNDCLPDGTVLATSSGNTQAQLFQEYIFARGQQHLTSGGFSTMGWAMPAAIGAKLARPDLPVLAIMGDGDFMMTMQELTVLARENIPVVVLVANNMGWMAIKDLQADVLGDGYLFGNDFTCGDKLYTPDFAAIAENFGIASSKISKQQEVAGALQEAFASGKPMLIEVDVHRDYPDSGGEAYGWWDVPIPTYVEDRRKRYEEAMLGEQV